MTPRAYALRVGVVACLAGASACGLGSDDARWVTARKGELVVSVDVEGQLASTESHPLGPPPIRHVWNFKISSMAVEGDDVEAGAQVIGFDVSELRRSLEEYQNEADSATKQLAAHRASAHMARGDNKLAIEEARAAERKAELKATGGAGILSRNEVEKARLEHEFAKYATEIAGRKLSARGRQDRAELDRLQRVKKRAEQRVTQIEQAMAKMRVVAPIAGAVLYKADWQGNKKKLGDNVWRAERIIEVVSLDHMKADGQVDEMDASRVSVGQAVRLRLDANADVELAGKVVAVKDNVKRRAPNDPLKVVELEIHLEDAAGVDLRPGMRFRGTVETERLTDLLIVPLDAVFATTGGPHVYLRDGDDAVPTQVTLGRRSKNMVEVISGLEPGDQVAVLEARRKEAAK